MPDKDKPFLRYYDEHPGEIEPRMVKVAHSVFSSSHAMTTEPCSRCGQSRTVVKTSRPLGVRSERGAGFFIEESVWRAAGIGRRLEPGTKIEVDIKVEKLVPFGFTETVTRVRVVTKV